MTTEKILEEFDREFVKDCGPDVEPIFICAVGSVGPIRQFLSEKLDQARAEERERVVRVIKAGVEKYKLSKQVGNMAGDYIFTYDLETFILSSLDKPLTDKE